MNDKNENKTEEYLQSLNKESFEEELHIAKEQSDSELVDYLNDYRAAIDSGELNWNTSFYDFLADRLDEENKVSDITPRFLES